VESCARCGKELAWHEQKTVFWNRQLKKGYIKWFVIGSMQMGKRKEFPQYKGKKLCQVCAHEVFNGPTAPEANAALPTQIKEETQANSSGGVIADFASLRDFLTENGVVMSAYSCPKCSNMVDIPENGKILICKHCGNPIKPAEIAEKIKSLM
jgi:DNA-directed RNA polymerase subunit RPC12/RpoP